MPVSCFARRVSHALRAAARLFLVFAALCPAARSFFVRAAFLPAARRFLVRAAFCAGVSSSVMA